MLVDLKEKNVLMFWKMKALGIDGGI
jgi:hypothetical protein